MQHAALTIVKTLQEQGFTAYFAGGAVRDILLGEYPDDIDIATNAKPDEIEKLFKRTFAIGKHFGVILVQEQTHHFEIATFRSDAGYSDGRRPDAVFFTTAEEDALRRDFTINGMFYDPVTKKFHDYVGGQEDLKNGILRFIGDAEERIQEDHLRLLRAVRFKNRFQLRYDKKTAAAIQKHASLIVSIAAERVREELTKMLIDPQRKDAFQDLFELELLSHILPELHEAAKIPQPKNYHSEGDVFRHTMLVIEQLGHEPNAELAWSALLHDIGKVPTLSYEEERIRFPQHAEIGADLAKKILKRLKFSNFSTSKIYWLIKHHHIFDTFDKMKWSTKLHYYDNPFFDDLLALHTADLFGCVPEDPEVHVRGEKDLKNIITEYKRAHFDNLLPSAQEEFFSGDEIMQILKLSPGKKIGTIKKALREAQLEGNVKTKEAAREWLEKHLSSP